MSRIASIFAVDGGIPMLKKNAFAMLVAGLLISGAAGLIPRTGLDANAQEGQGWNPATKVTPLPQDGWATESKPTEGEAVESEAVRRAREALSAPQAGSGVALSARLTEDGQRLTRGLIWRVYSDPKPGSGKPELLVKQQSSSPTIRLEPGTYLVNVAYGRSHLTKRVTVSNGPGKPETFVLNAGGLRLTAYAGEQKVPDTTVSFNIYLAETDQSGQRRQIMTKARPGVIIRLNAGIYFLRSTYGGANAHVEAEVSVEAGKLTEIAIAHAAARVTFGLVTRPGGEALPATQWTIATPEGDEITQSVGALPTHILAPGSYTVTARNGGREFKREFKVEDSQMARVEVLAE
jgi:hypothetical protein